MSDAPEKIRKGDGKRKRGHRSGFTTGANAAAAARAATLGLLTGEVPAYASSASLPNGQDVTFAVLEGHVADAEYPNSARAVIVKDAGDDPDATNGAHLTAEVRRLPGAAGRIVLKGGEGVGTVTKEGLGLEVGGPAINPVPRRNIVDNARAVAGELLDHDGLEITISVPGGAEMAKKTLNARLGILGGISILGTTGIVRPYSTAAFRASVVQAVDVAANQGQTGDRLHHRWPQRKVRHAPVAGARRSLLRADGRFCQSRVPDGGQAQNGSRLHWRDGRQTDQDGARAGRHPCLEGRHRPRPARRTARTKWVPHPTSSSKSATPKPRASPPNGWPRSGCPSISTGRWQKRPSAA
jgi:hypothetical protein